MWRWLSALGLCLLVLSSHAAELESSKFRKHAAHYLIDVSIRVAVPEDYARSVLIDPDRVKSFTPSIKSVEHLPQHVPGMQRFIDNTTVCAFIFCISYRNIMQLRLGPHGKIELQVEPRGSDFRYGRVVWETAPLDANSSRLSFHAVLEPSFWIPPALGTVIMGSRMRDSVYEMARRMECEYQQLSECILYPWQELDDDHSF